MGAMYLETKEAQGLPVEARSRALHWFLPRTSEGMWSC